MLDNGSNLKKNYFDIKIFEKSCDIYNEKHNQIYYFYNNIFEINVERILKMMMIIINIIL